MDPLFKVRDALDQGAIPDATYARIAERFPLVLSGIGRIERASGLDYPAAYVEPSAIVSRPDPGTFQYGILFARTIPVVTDAGLQVVIQVSAPLVAYGLKGTVHAVLAHEFLHYVELVRRVSRMEVLSDEISGSIFENAYADGTRLFEPAAVFGDRTLLAHITKRFPAGFRDYRLEEKTVKLWIDRGLPKTGIALDSNTTRLSAESLARARPDPALLARLPDMEQKSARIKRRRGY